MELYYLFIIICSIPAMHNINKLKPYKPFDIGTSLYKFNTAACVCLILFTLIIALIPIILKMSIISKYIVQMFIYLLVGSPSSTSNFLIAKIWLAPGTSGGDWKEESQGFTIIFFFLFNLFIGFLSFYNYTRELRANCVMGLAIFYLIYLFFKVIAILFPLLCGSQLIADKDHKIISALSGEDVVHSINENENDNDNRNNNPLANSTDKLKSSQNHNNEIEEEKLDASNHEENNNQENNSYNENNENRGDNENNENNENSRQFEAEQNKNEESKKEGINQDEI